MNRPTMQEYAQDYTMGFITYTELVDRLCQCDHEDARIMSEAVDKVKESSAYLAFVREFERKVGELYEQETDIDDIARYYIRKAYKK